MLDRQLSALVLADPVRPLRMEIGVGAGISAGRLRLFVAAAPLN